jgi:hypothetical protein
MVITFFMKGEKSQINVFLENSNTFRIKYISPPPRKKIVPFTKNTKVKVKIILVQAVRPIGGVEV